MAVELVTRVGCHLCEEAEGLLRRGGVEVTLCDVDADPELFRLYDFRVPVVLLDGRVVAEGRIVPEVISRLGGATRT
jgi:glutaredoxin